MLPEPSRRQGFRHDLADAAPPALRPGRAHVLPHVLDGRRAHDVGPERRGQDQGHRARAAGVARVRDQGRQCLPQPVPAAGPVLRAGRAGDHRAQGRPSVRDHVVDLRALAHRACVRAHRLQPAARAVLRVCARRPRAPDHVDHLRRARAARSRMTPAARLAAAIEVLADIEARRRPAADALRDWGLGHRFAGSGDRAAIGGLVYDALRHKASSAWLMQDTTSRAILLGMLRRERALAVDAIAALADGSRHAPEPLTGAERERLAKGSLDEAPPHVVGDYPEWLDPALAATFGEARAEEGAALAARAPLDLRVNTLKADRGKAAAALPPPYPRPPASRPA